MVTLDGSGSSDVRGDSLSYRWSLSVPAGSSATLSNHDTINPTFDVDAPGNYVAQLIVNDGNVDSDPDTCIVNAIIVDEPIPDVDKCQEFKNRLDRFKKRYDRHKGSKSEKKIEQLEAKYIRHVSEYEACLAEVNAPYVPNADEDPIGRFHSDSDND